MIKNDALIAEARTAPADERAARRALASMDLTRLGDDDTDKDILDLCGRAVNAAGRVAAVCIHEPFIPVAANALAGTGVRVATVCNFPKGASDIEAAAAQAAAEVAAGADEVDVVLPYKAYLSGDRRTALGLISEVRDACGEATLKVIIESGALSEPVLIEQASRDVILAGADFIKTSTGKISVGATPEAAAVMLSVIQSLQDALGRLIGFKPAGGISSVADAAVYLALADAILGPDWATPETFRIGASSLLNSVLETLGLDGGAGGTGGY